MIEGKDKTKIHILHSSCEKCVWTTITHLGNNVAIIDLPVSTENRDLEKDLMPQTNLAFSMSENYLHDCLNTQ